MPPIIAVTPDGTEHEFPEGTPDSVVDAAMKRHITGQAAQPSQPSGLMRAMSARGRAEGAAGLLPPIGGAVGGLAGRLVPIPGANVAGAGAGGAIFEALRQAALGMPMNAGQIGQQGAVQAGSEVAGGALAKGARFAGRAMMQGALRPTLQTVKEFGDVASSAIKERVPVGKIPVVGRTRGSEVAGKRVRESSERLNLLLDSAEARGVRFTVNDLLGPVKELARDIRKQPLGSADNKQLAKMVNEFVARHNGVLTPRNVKELKQSAWELAKPILKAGKKGTIPTADRAMEARFHDAIGMGAKRALETIPGVAGREAQTQKLIGLRGAVNRAEQGWQTGPGMILPSLMGRGAMTAAGGSIGASLPANTWQERLAHGLIGAGAGATLSAPSIMSRGALGVTSPMSQEALRQIPRPLLSLLFPPESPFGTTPTGNP